VTVTVRPVVAADAPGLFLLVKQFPTPTPCPAETFCVLFDSKLKDPRSCVIVAEQDGRLVGYVSGSVRTAFYAGGATAWVDEILVVPALRSGGVGQQLMRAFETWAANNNSVSVALATRGAAKFYEKLGYESRAAYFKKYLAGVATPSRESKG
jgi:GNAT superfamily N-acetyltransferase